MDLSKKQEILFKTYLLKSICEKNMPLPDRLELNKVYRSVYYKYGNRGCRDLRFVVVKNDNVLFIDYLFITDDYSSHNRIDSAGNIKKLENYEGQFGWPILATEEDTEKEHQRIRLHNQKVHLILISKGLEEKVKGR